IILIVVIVIVVIVLVFLYSRHKRDPSDSVELLDTSTVPTMTAIPTSDVLWDFEDPEEDEEKEGRMQQKELSNISKRVKLTEQVDVFSSQLLEATFAMTTSPACLIIQRGAKPSIRIGPVVCSQQLTAESRYPEDKH